jgi:AcrR family transcriptional regulator
VDRADPKDVDPRLARSRSRLIEATKSLLLNSGLEAVTVEAVARESGVARTTLYRHFGSSAALLAAAFEDLLPNVPVVASAPGSLQQQVTKLLVQQATLIEEAPTQLTALAWLALLSHAENASGETDMRDAASLRSQIVHQYRQAFDELLTGQAARCELGAFDLDLAIVQLIGPLVFAQLSGIKTIRKRDCERIVMDFFAANRKEAPSRDVE